MSLRAQPSNYLRRHWPTAVVFLAGAILTAGLGWELHREALETDRKRLAIRIEEVIDQLDGRVEKTEQLLQHLQDFLPLTGSDNARLFREWTRRRGLAYNFPWVRGVLVATNMQPPAWQVAPVVLAKNSTNWPAFEAFAASLELECRVAMSTLPHPRFHFLDDYDLRGSHVSIKPANGFSKAAWSPGVRLSGPQTVMFDMEGLPVTGVLFFTPVHHPHVAEALQLVGGGDGQRIRAVRWTHLEAMIVAAVDFQELEHAIWDGKESDLGLEIFASRQPTPESWLNRSGPAPKALDRSFASRPYLTATVQWPMYSERYSIFFHTTPLFEAQSSRRLARTVTTAGAVLTLLATALAGVITRARARQQQMTAEILEARDALAETQKEREKLGHDLHDGAIQSLYAVQLGLSRTAESVNAHLPDEAEGLRETRKRIDGVIAELRRFIQAGAEGRESAETPGLEQVFGSMAGWLRPTTTARLSFEVMPGVSARLNPVQTLALVQIARTALGNALRHAQARQIKLELHGDDTRILLRVEDDGIGFVPEQLEGGGLGLHTMKTRAAGIGAILEIDTQPGRGTRVTVTMPASGIRGNAGRSGPGRRTDLSRAEGPSERPAPTTNEST